jgi:DNA-binding HxlR family transcriptional regulator
MGLRESLEECGLPLALQAMGERWSFMILRAAFNGVSHFEDFLTVLGIARNILSNRLAALVENGIMERAPCEHDRRKVEYKLTPKGVDLLPAMIALRQWGEKHVMGVPSNPVLVDIHTRQPIEPVAIRSLDGRALAWSELMWLYREELGREDVDCCGPEELPALQNR